MELSTSSITTLKSCKLSLEDWVILNSLNSGLDYHAQLGIDSEERYRKLVRRGFLDSGYNLTETGLKVVRNEVEAAPPKPKKRGTILGEGNFEEFWAMFPKTDKYAHHPQTRTLRTDKLRTSVYYNSIIAEGKITHAQLLECLKKDIEMRQRASLSKQNEFKYMPAAPTWLNKGIYEPYLEETGEKQSSQTNYGESIE